MKIDNNCSSGKSAFTSKKSADHASKLVVGGGRKLRVYKCTECGMWHLTSSYSCENQKLYTNAHKFKRTKANEGWANFKLNMEISKVYPEKPKKEEWVTIRNIAI